MSIFKKAISQGNTGGAQVKGPEDRDKSGPLPVVGDVNTMNARLAAERERVVAGTNGCCVVVCSPDPLHGWSTDETIAETAKRFANSLRAYDSIFLHGADKLLVCLPFVKASDAPSVMLRLRDLASRMPVQLPGGTSGHIKVSLGGVMMDRTTDVAQIIQRADKAMEQGRISGNRTCLWSLDLL